jgi:hypothetical protein
MKKFALLAAVAAVSASSHALVFDFGLVYTGATPGGTDPWLTVTIDDIAPDTVNMQIQHNAGSAAGQFITNVYFNLDPFINPISISNEVNGNKRNGFSLSNNGVNGAAGNLFDMVISFNSSNSGGGVNRLKPGETWSANLTGTGLTANTFMAINNKGNFAGAHLQGIAGGLSSHITTSNPPPVVPEPASMAALGLGVASLIRRRKTR